MDNYLSDSMSLSSPPASPCELLDFPSPPPSQDSDGPRTGPCQDDVSPPKKRRRVSPKERITQRLYLSPSAGISRPEQQQQIDLLRETIRGHRKIIVVAGAGISTNAGIPDFRSSDGLFKGLQKKHNLKASGKLLFDAAVYQDEALMACFHEMVRSLSEESEAAKSSPTRFHCMLARLGKEKRLTRLYTQNIDGIETSLQPLETKIPLNHKNPPLTIQLHGSLDKMVCQKCRAVGDLDRKLFESSEAPECKDCASANENRQAAGYRSHGIGRLRPRIVLYNEHNPDEEAIASIMNADVRSRPDTLIVSGTSLKIPGVRHLVRNLCRVIRSRKNGVTIWINNEPPIGKEFEDCWDLIVEGNCDDVADIAGLKAWNDESVGEIPQSGDNKVGKACERDPNVVISPPKEKKQQILTGLMTPSLSNDENSTVPHKRTAGREGTKSNKPKKAARKGQRAKAKPSNKPKRITDFNRTAKPGIRTLSAKEKDARPMVTIPPASTRGNQAQKRIFPNLGKNA